MLLTNVHEGYAAQLAERVRQRVAELNIPHGASPQHSGTLTLSAGISALEKLDVDRRSARPTPRSIWQSTAAATISSWHKTSSPPCCSRRNKYPVRLSGRWPQAVQQQRQTGQCLLQRSLLILLIRDPKRGIHQAAID